MKTTSSNQREKALVKIRKMFALANDPSASEGEIENALKFAQQMMAKFDIEHGEVDLSPDDIDILETENNYTKLERKYWFGSLLNVIAKNNGCDIVMQKKTVVKKTKWDDTYQTYYKIIGTRNDRSLVKEMFDMTVPIVRNLAQKRFDELKEKSKTDKSIKLPSLRFWVASYIDGFIVGLGQKLAEQKTKTISEDETGKYKLILVSKNDLVQNFIKEKVGQTKLTSATTATSVDSKAFRSGIKDGKSNQNKKLM